jgi:O-antigen/teichoic acid export membrane protein
MSLLRSIAKNSALQMAGKIVGTLIGLATFYALIHGYDTDGYGIFTTAITFVTLFAVVADFGLTLTATSLISEAQADEGHVMSNIVTLRLFSAGGFMLLAPLTALFLPHYHSLLPLITAATVTYFFNVLNNVFLSVFQKRLNMTVPVVAEVAARALSYAAVLWCVAQGYSLLYATLAFTLGSVLQFVIFILCVRNFVGLRLAFDCDMWKTILQYSWPIGASIFFNLLYLKGDVLFLWSFGRSAEEIGQYGSAYKVVDVLTILPVMIMGLALPSLSRLWSEKNTSEVRRMLQKIFDGFSLLCIPSMAGAWVLGVPVMLLVKSDLTLAGMLLWVLVPTGAMVFWGSLYGHAVVALHKQRVMLVNYLIVAAFALAGYWLLVPRFGAWGAAWVSLFSESAIGILAMILVCRTVGAKPNLRVFACAVIASLVMTAALLVAPWAVWVDVLFGVAIYAAVLEALRRTRLLQI